MHTRRARELRKTLTKAEARLWLRLKALRGEGFHFRRQAPFRGYFLDFVCYDRRLVIELDGWRHGEEENALHDEIRDGVLRREGFHVMRFWNRELDADISSVMDSIIRALDGQPSIRGGSGHSPTLTASPSVPPHKGEGGK